MVGVWLGHGWGKVGALLGMVGALSGYGWGTVEDNLGMVGVLLEQDGALLELC